MYIVQVIDPCAVWSSSRLLRGRCITFNDVHHVSWVQYVLQTTWPRRRNINRDPTDVRQRGALQLNREIEEIAFGRARPSFSNGVLKRWTYNISAPINRTTPWPRRVRNIWDNWLFCDSLDLSTKEWLNHYIINTVAVSLIQLLRRDIVYWVAYPVGSSTLGLRRLERLSKAKTQEKHNNRYRWEQHLSTRALHKPAPYNAHQVRWVVQQIPVYSTSLARHCAAQVSGPPDEQPWKFHQLEFWPMY